MLQVVTDLINYAYELEPPLNGLKISKQVGKHIEMLGVQQALRSGHTSVHAFFHLSLPPYPVY